MGKGKYSYCSFYENSMNIWIVDTLSAIMCVGGLRYRWFRTVRLPRLVPKLIVAIVLDEDSKSHYIHLKRMELFEHLISYFPNSMTPPKANLLDFIQVWAQKIVMLWLDIVVW